MPTVLPLREKEAQVGENCICNPNHQPSFKTLPFLTVLLAQAHKKGKYNKKKDRLINLLLKLVYSMREQSTKSRSVLGQTVVPYEGSVLHGPLEQNHSCKRRSKGMSRGHGRQYKLGFSRVLYEVTSGGMTLSHPLILKAPYPGLFMCLCVSTYM